MTLIATVEWLPGSYIGSLEFCPDLLVVGYLMTALLSQKPRPLLRCFILAPCQSFFSVIVQDSAAVSGNSLQLWGVLNLKAPAASLNLLKHNLERHHIHFSNCLRATGAVLHIMLRDPCCPCWPTQKRHSMAIPTLSLRFWVQRTQWSGLGTPNPDRYS